jgi:hypothetical protein
MLRTLLLLTCLWMASSAQAQLQLTCFAYSDRALTVHAGGDFVDPYFVNRALLTARDIGIDISDVATGWVEWALNYQRSDGRFDRYCHGGGNRWQSCAEADADDAVLALWQQLLYELNPSAAHNGAWQDSVSRAAVQLDGLLNAQRGVYYIAQTQPTGLFMDNVEIFDALNTIAQQQRAIGAKSAASKTTARATTLARAINTVFWQPSAQRYAVATQDYETEAFYPHVVAQIYPWLFDMPSPLKAKDAYQAWLAKHGETWLAFEQDKYPWGLVAVAADKLGDTKTARRWLERASSLRYTARWNILEEAIFQALSFKYAIPVDHMCPQEPL